MIMDSSLLDQFLTPVILALSTGVATLIFLGFQKLQKKLGLQIKAEEEKLVQEIIERAVLKTMQTVVGTLKDSVTGKLSPQGARDAMASTKDEVLNQLKILGGDFASKYFVGVENRIEAMIPLVKAKI